MFPEIREALSLRSAVISPRWAAPGLGARKPHRRRYRGTPCAQRPSEPYSAPPSVVIIGRSPRHVYVLCCGSAAEVN